MRGLFAPGVELPASCISCPFLCYNAFPQKCLVTDDDIPEDFSRDGCPLREVEIEDEK